MKGGEKLLLLGRIVMSDDDSVFGNFVAVVKSVDRVGRMCINTTAVPFNPMKISKESLPSLLLLCIYITFHSLIATI